MPFTVSKICSRVAPRGPGSLVQRPQVSAPAMGCNGWKMFSRWLRDCSQWSLMIFVKLWIFNVCGFQSLVSALLLAYWKMVSDGLDCLQSSQIQLESLGLAGVQYQKQIQLLNWHLFQTLHWDRPWPQCTASECSVKIQRMQTSGFISVQSLLQSPCTGSSINWWLHCSIHINLSFVGKIQEKQRRLGPISTYYGSTSTPVFCQVAWASEKKGKQTKLLQCWARTRTMKWRSGITITNIAAISKLDTTIQPQQSA